MSTKLSTLHDWSQTKSQHFVIIILVPVHFLQLQSLSRNRSFVIGTGENTADEPHQALSPQTSPPHSPTAKLMRLISRRAFRLFTDGASRGNPGPAGIGAALYTNHGVVHAQLSSFVGPSTCNAAEYRACLQGLLLARALHVPRLIVLSDSQLMVRHMQGKYVVRNPRLKRLHKLVEDVVASFDKCAFSYIGREHNRVADRLANDALDTRRKNHIVLNQPTISLYDDPSLDGFDVEIATSTIEQTEVQ